MAFTINQPLEPVPAYPALCKLAERNQVTVAGDERAGSFSGRGVEGKYEYGPDSLRASFAGHGIVGEFSAGAGQAAVTVLDKPFWLPEALLRQKIREGLERFVIELAQPAAGGAASASADGA
jgi:hypothetical protein